MEFQWRTPQPRLRTAVMPLRQHSRAHRPTAWRRSPGTAIHIWLRVVEADLKPLNIGVASWVRCTRGYSWILERPSCSDARPIDAGIDYRLLPWRLALPLCYLFLPFVIWEFLSTVTWWCAHMCTALSRTASPCWVSCAASVTLSLRQTSSRSSLLRSSAVWTMVTVRWLVFRSTSNDASSQFRPQPIV